MQQQHDVTLLVMSKLLEKIHDTLADVKRDHGQNTERIDVLMQAHTDLVEHNEKQHAFVVGSMEGFWERLGAVEKRTEAYIEEYVSVVRHLNGIGERVNEIDKRFASFDVEQCPLRERIDEIERQLPPEAVALEVSEGS